MKPGMLACFYIGSQEIAVDAMDLVEVISLPHDYAQTETSLRGRQVYLVEAAALLGISPSVNVSETKKIAVIRYGKCLVGLCFERTSRVLMPSPSSPVGSEVILFSVQTLAQDMNLARRLAESSQVKEEVPPGSKKTRLKKCLVFQCGDLQLGFDMERVREILAVPQIDRSVLAVDACRGLFRLRGMVIPIVDLRSFFGRSPMTEGHQEQKIMVVRKEDRQIGLLVDRIESIAQYFQEDIQPVMEVTERWAQFASASVETVSGQPLHFVDEESILDDPEVLALSIGHRTLYGSSCDNRKVQKITERKMYLRFQMQYPLSAHLNGIDEIALPSGDMRPLESPAAWVVAELNLRGETVKVIDLKRYYGLGSIQDSSAGKILVVRGAREKYGLLVESVDAIETVDESQKNSLPHFLVKNVLRDLQGDLKEFVEMTDMSGHKKAFLILDIADLIKKLERQSA